jgi:hypothetical protein
MSLMKAREVCILVAVALVTAPALGMGVCVSRIGMPNRLPVALPKGLPWSSPKARDD